MYVYRLYMYRLAESNFWKNSARKSPLMQRTSRVPSVAETSNRPACFQQFHPPNANQLFLRLPIFLSLPTLRITITFVLLFVRFSSLKELIFSYLDKLSRFRRRERKLAFDAKKTERKIGLECSNERRTRTERGESVAVSLAKLKHTGALRLQLLTDGKRQRTSHGKG